MKKTLMVLVTLFALAGCYSDRARIKVATKEFAGRHNCPKDQVVVNQYERLGFYEAKGCGQSAKYVCTPMAMSFHVRCNPMPEGQ